MAREITNYEISKLYAEAVTVKMHYLLHSVKGSSLDTIWVAVSLLDNYSCSILKILQELQGVEDKKQCVEKYLKQSFSSALDAYEPVSALMYIIDRNEMLRGYKVSPSKLFDIVTEVYRSTGTVYTMQDFGRELRSIIKRGIRVGVSQNVQSERAVPIWERYGLKKTTYYRRKAEGTLPKLMDE